MNFGQPPIFHKAVALLLALLSAGCGEPMPFDVATVSGKVTYADGTPIDAEYVIIRFYPQDVEAVGGKYPRPAEGTLEACGTFSNLSTAGFGDGVIPGRHRVVLEAYGGATDQRRRAVSARYRDPQTTPLEVEVTGGGPNRFELVVEKPE